MRLSLIGLIIGLIFFFISMTGIFLNDMDFVKKNDFLQGYLDAVGNYNYWIFMLMLVLIIGAGWIFGDLFLSLQKFKNLMNTTSKATFVRNLNEIEELAWKLGPIYIEMVAERKHEFRIKK